MGSMGGGAAAMAGMPMLPHWLRAVLALVLLGVVALHVRHAWSLPGQSRWWHAGHTLMAAGMALMYLLPSMTHPGLYRAGLVLFALVTVALVATAGRLRRREGILNPLWLASAGDSLAMTVMLLPAPARPAALGWLFVGYLCCQVVAWSLGLWRRVPVLWPAVAVPAAAPAQAVTVPAGNPATDSPTAATRVGNPATGSRGGTVGLPVHCTPAVRISLAVMAATMAVMMAVM